MHAQIKRFEFLFGVVLGEIILRHTDNLSKTLQAKALSAAEGQEIASMVVVTLETLRDDTSFDAFWQKVSMCVESFDIRPPELPRKRKAPKRLQDGLAEAEFPIDVKGYYRQHYFEAIDLAA